MALPVNRSDCPARSPAGSRGALLAGCVALFGIFSACGNDDVRTGAVLWQDAANYVGEVETVCGPVAETHQETGPRGQPTFINVGRSFPEPDRFTVVIWEEHRANFDEAPDRAYDGETICVTGEIELYEGVPQIEVQRPAQIELN